MIYFRCTKTSGPFLGQKFKMCANELHRDYRVTSIKWCQLMYIYHITYILKQNIHIIIVQWWEVSFYTNCQSPKSTPAQYWHLL